MRDLVRMSDIIRIYNNYDCDKAREEVMKLSSIDMIEELEKIKQEIIEKYWDCDICKYNGHFNIRGNINDILQIIDKHISELKGEAE